MTRSFWIKAHLIAAAFFTPALILIAISGGLYLLGIKGEVTQTPVSISAGTKLNFESSDLQMDVSKLLDELNIEHDFEYLKVSGNTVTTRPTSRIFYTFSRTREGVEIAHNRPSLQKVLVELHKGHGPMMFKDFQKAMAFGLLFILLSGTWLGLSSQGLRSTTVAAAGSGLALMLALILAP